MNENSVKIQKTLEIFKEIHLKNSSEYKKGNQEYHKLTPTEEWNEEHNLSFVEIQKILAEIVKDDEEKSFITYLSDPFIFGPGNIGREDLSWNKYVDIIKQSSNYLKYFEDLKKGNTEVKGSYQVVFEQGKLNAFCSSIISEVMAKNKNNNDFLINQQDNKKSERSLIARKNGNKLIEDLSDKEVVIKIEKDKKGYRNIRRGYDFKFIRNGITIIVGENDVGKTNLLDFIYYENNEWDGVSSNKHTWKDEKWYTYLPLFFGNKPILCNLRPSKTHVSTGQKIKYSYKFYYFDLKTITDFLNQSSEPIEIEKLRKHDFYLAPIIDSKNEDMALVGNSYSSDDDFWLLDYGSNEKFTRNKVVSGLQRNVERYEYEARNKHAKEPDHGINNIGSGYQKHEKLKSLISYIERQNLPSDEEIFATLLTIDEPEVFLHPSSVSNAANLIKNLKETTKILTTHSPSFLSHFDLTNHNKTSLVILKKDEKESLKDPLYLEEFLKDDKIQEKIREDYKKFADLKREKFDHENFCDFYKSKWGRLFNQETLRVFFAKKVLFVEGMVDYILFNNILKKEMHGELKEVEIIPIFGKFHYIFFYELARWLNLDFWFLLDEDKDKDENWKEVYGNKEVNKVFWEKYGEGKVSEKKDGMIHSKEEKEAKISWICYDLEIFLGIKDDSAKDKEYNLLRREIDAIRSLKDKNSAKFNELKKIFTDFLKIKEE